MTSVPRMLGMINISEWDDRILDISNWDFRVIEKQSPSPTCVFSVKISLRLPGFEKVSDIHHVDESDMTVGAFTKYSDPQNAYLNYMRSQFRVNVLVKAAKMVQVYRENQAASISRNVLTAMDKTKARLDGITDPFEKRQAVKLANLKYDMKKKGFIGKDAPNSGLDYFKLVRPVI